MENYRIAQIALSGKIKGTIRTMDTGTREQCITQFQFYNDSIWYRYEVQRNQGFGWKVIPF